MTTQVVEGRRLLESFKRASAHFSKARQVNLDMLLHFGQVPALVRVRDGCVSEILETSVPLQSSDFSIKGTLQGWQNFWKPYPEAGWHDIFALNKRKEFCIEGNLQPLMAHLQFIKDLLASARGSAT